MMCVMQLLDTAAFAPLSCELVVMCDARIRFDFQFLGYCHVCIMGFRLYFGCEQWFKLLPLPMTDTIHLTVAATLENHASFTPQPAPDASCAVTFPAPFDAFHPPSHFVKFLMPFCVEIRFVSRHVVIYRICFGLFLAFVTGFALCFIAVNHLINTSLIPSQRSSERATSRHACARSAVRFSR